MSSAPNNTLRFRQWGAPAEGLAPAGAARFSNGASAIVRSDWFSSLGGGVPVREDTPAGVGWELNWEDSGENRRMSRGGPASWSPDQFQLLLEFTAQSADLLEDLLARLA
jgi:hypothetical protein